MADIIHSFESLRVYYRESNQPPYLRNYNLNDDSGGGNTNSIGRGLGTTTANGDPTLAAMGAAVGSGATTPGGMQASTPSSQQQQTGGDADAAAGGGFGKRVSSFNLIPRVASVDTVNRIAVQQPSETELLSGQRHLSRGMNGRSTANSNQRQREESKPREEVIKPDWRLKDRMKTVGVGLVLALNVGTDPPDITKPHPCAVLECWIDPGSVSRAKAKEIIGERLEQQYAKWQLARTARPLKYRRALDPTVEDVRALCLQLRRQARNERILLHYNGHGVPRPTAVSIESEIKLFIFLLSDVSHQSFPS